MGWQVGTGVCKGERESMPVGHTVEVLSSLLRVLHVWASSHQWEGGGELGLGGSVEGELSRELVKGLIESVVL